MGSKLKTVVPSYTNFEYEIFLRYFFLNPILNLYEILICFLFSSHYCFKFHSFGIFNCSSKQNLHKYSILLAYSIVKTICDVHFFRKSNRYCESDSFLHTNFLAQPHTIFFYQSSVIDNSTIQLNECRRSFCNFIEMTTRFMLFIFQNVYVKNTHTQN